MATRREKGLCFNYDEKFGPGHICSSNLFVLIAEEGQAMKEDDEFGVEEDETRENPTPAQISFHALVGHLAPGTLRFFIISYVSCSLMHYHCCFIQYCRLSLEVYCSLSL